MVAVSFGWLRMLGVVGDECCRKDGADGDVGRWCGYGSGGRCGHVDYSCSKSCLHVSWDCWIGCHVRADCCVGLGGVSGCEDVGGGNWCGCDLRMHVGLVLGSEDVCVELMRSSAVINSDLSSEYVGGVCV